MPPWLFWRTPAIPRPPDPLDDSVLYQVYNIPGEEAKGHEVITTSNKKSEEPLVYLSKSKIQARNCYEVILKRDKVAYSVARSLDRSEGLSNYNRLKSLILALLKYAPKGSRLPEVAVFLQKLVEASNNDPELGEVHLAARMGLDQPFKQQVPIYKSKVNQQVGPKKAIPLILAILSDREETVSAILSMNPDLTILDVNKNSALHHAANSGNAQILRPVLDAYYKKFQFEYIRKKNDFGLTSFHYGCYSKKNDVIIQFLELKLPMDILNASRPVQLYRRKVSEPRRRAESVTVVTDEDLKERKRQEKTRVTFSRQMMIDLDWSEIKMGGTPLHWVTTRRTLDLLLPYQFPKDTLNFNQESVIHVMVRRKRLRCLIILLSCEFSPNLMARQNLTPLHYAILDEGGKSDVTLVQVLAVFDADLDASAHGQTPRHMTQNIADPDDRDIVLYILHSLGAHRCEKRILNSNTHRACFNGCEPLGINDGRPCSQWPPLEGQALYTKYLIDHLVQTKRDTSNGKKRVNMLCCDGGGTRGIIAAQMLIELQKNLTQPLHKYFHWLSGTSTGSFIAAYLALNRTPREIRRHYVTLKDNIFAGQRPYSTTVVEKFLKNVLPEKIVMGDIKDKKLIIPAVQADCSPVQLHLFRSYPAPEDIAASSRTLSGTFDRQPQDSSNVPLWYACRASGAAPSYFKPAGPYIDGGLLANNPTIDSMTDFYMYNKALESIGRKDECEVLGTVISLGTGRWPILHQAVLNVGQMRMTAPRQSYNQAIALVTTLSIVSSMTDNFIVDRAQAWCSTLQVPYFRLSPPISEQLPLDVKNDSDLVNAMYETKAYCYHLQDEFNLLADVLETSIGSPNRIPSVEHFLKKRESLTIKNKSV